MNPYYPLHQHVRCSVTTPLPLRDLAWMCGYLSVMHTSLPRQVGEVNLLLQDDLAPWVMVTLLGSLYGCVPHIELGTPPDPAGAERIDLSTSLTMCRQGEWGTPDHRRAVSRVGVRRALLLLVLAEAWTHPAFSWGKQAGPLTPAPTHELHLLSQLLATGEMRAGWTDFNGRSFPAGRVFPADPAEHDWLDRPY